MADEKKTVKEKDEGTQAQPKKEGKFVTFCKNLPRRIATPFKNMWHELKKVTWPTKKDLINYTCIVLVFMVFMGIVIGLLDMGASKLVAAVSNLKTTDTVENNDGATSDDGAGNVPEPDDNASVDNDTAADPTEAPTDAPTDAPASGN